MDAAVGERTVSAPPAEEGTRRPSGRSDRLAYLDNLKVLMVAGVIVGHAIAGYAGMNWTYADVAEGEMGNVSQALFGVLILPFAVFVMALFFLVAGLLTPGSLDRKGPGRFARDRLGAHAQARRAAADGCRVRLNQFTSTVAIRENREPERRWPLN